MNGIIPISPIAPISKDKKREEKKRRKTDRNRENRDTGFGDILKEMMKEKGKGENISIKAHYSQNKFWKCAKIEEDASMGGSSSSTTQQPMIYKCPKCGKMKKITITDIVQDKHYCSKGHDRVKMKKKKNISITDYQKSKKKKKK